MEYLFDLVEGATRWRKWYHSVESEMSNENLDRFWLERLAVPSLDSAELLNEYSQFVSKNFPADQYVDKMKRAREVEVVAERIAAKLEKYEVELSNDPADPAKWTRYLQACNKLKNSEFRVPLTKAVFGRMIGNTRPNDDRWLEPWAKYASFKLETDDNRLCKEMVTRVGGSAIPLALTLGGDTEDIWVAVVSAASRGTYDELLHGILAKVAKQSSCANGEKGPVDIVKGIFYKCKDNQTLRDCIELVRRWDEKDAGRSLIEAFLDMISSDPNTSTSDWTFCLGVAQGWLPVSILEELYDVCASILDQTENPQELLSLWRSYKLAYGLDSGSMDEWMLRPKQQQQQQQQQSSTASGTKRPRENRRDFPRLDALAQALDEGREVYVTDISFNATEDELKELFGKCGEIEAVKLPLRRNADKPKCHNDGFGYVSYVSKEAADKAVSELDGNNLGGRPLHVVPAEPRKVKRQQKPGFEKRQKRFDPKRTLAIPNAPATLAPLLQEKMPGAKIEPFGNGFYAEFPSERESGMASLSLDGTPLGESGAVIRFGSIGALKKRKERD